MKNMEKLVPVAVAGLMLASAGTLDARAEDVNLNTLPQEGDQPALEQPEASNPLDTNIQEAVPAPKPDGNEEDEQEENKNSSQVIVNPSVDGEGNVTGDILDVNTKPDPDATKVENIPGTPLPPVTTDNGDGSTTTTTTTPTTDVTTEESTTTITGPVNSEEDNTPPTTEEETPVKDALSDALDAIKNKGENDEWDGTYDWDNFHKVGDFDATHEAGEEDENGNPTHTITLTREETSDAPLKPEELGKVLGVELTEHTNEDGSTYYTYTGANGAAGTIRNVVDNSTEKKTTTWVLTLTEQTVEQTGNGEVKGDEIVIPDGQPPMTDLPDQPAGSLSVKDVLDKVDGDKFDNEDATITKDKDGNITQIVSGSTTYEFTYTAGETINIENLSIADIFTLLPDSYTMGKDAENNDVIFDAQGHELTFTEGQKVYTVMNVTMSMVNTQAGTEDHITQDGQEIATPDDTANEANAEKNAAIAAVVKALQADQITGIDENSVKAQLDQDTDGNGIWVVTVTATVDGKQKTFTYTVSSSSSTEEEKWDATKVDEKNIDNLVDGSGSTVTTTGSAYVSGEKVTWSGTENETTSKFISVTNKGEATVGASVDQVIDQATGEKVVKVEGNVITTRYSVKDETTGVETITEKVYTFTTGLTPNETDMADFLAQQGAQFNEVTGLSKISWEVNTSVWTKTPNTGNDVTNEGFGQNGEGQQVTDNQGSVPATKEGDTYKYGDFTLTKDDKNSTGTKTVYTYEDTTNNKVYTVEEEKVALTDAEIVALIKKDQTIPEGANVTIDRTAGTATYMDGTSTVTISFNASDLTKTTVKMTVTESKSFASTESKEDMVNKAVAWIQEQFKADNAEAIKILEAAGITKDTQHDVIYNIIWEANQALQGVPDFTEFQDQDLIDLLNDLAKKSDQDPDRKEHFDLDIAGTMNKVEDDGSVTEGISCVIVPDDFEVILNETAEGLVHGTGSAQQKFNSGIYWDRYYWEYQHSGDPVKLDSKNPNRPSRADVEDMNFYKVTGTVAYDELGTYTTEWRAQQALHNGGYTEGKVVYFGGSYHAYKSTAELTAYGYMGDDSNVCAVRNKGYDLALSGLTLLQGGEKITATGKDVTTWSTTIHKQTTLGEVMNQSLTLLNKQTSTPKTGFTESDKTVTTTNDKQLNGAWTITQEKAVTETVEEGGQTVTKYLHEAGGSSSYDVYQTWTQGTGSGQASYNKLIDNLALGYTYTYEVPGEPDIVIDSRSIQSVRNVNVVLDNTTVTTAPGKDIEDVVINRPTTPPPVIEDDDDDDDDDDDGPTIVDEDVPLVETPELPDVEIPDEEVPMVETPDVELPDEDVPLAELPDEEVPLAAVPQTNDSFLLEALALVSSGMSALWLGLNKKRK